MKNRIRLKTRVFTLLYFTILPPLSILAQVNYTANDRVVPYDTSFRFGLNMGFYAGWNNEQLGNLATGNAALGIKGIGATTQRPALYEEILETFGYNALVTDYERWYQAGMRDMTVIVGGPSGAHKDYTNYCPTRGSEMFSNLYEPIWDGGANGTPVNERNFYALYLWKTVTTYKKYVKVWEIVNEPDYDKTFTQWRGDYDLNFGWWRTDPNPCDYQLHAPIQHYVRMLRVSWEIIKTVDPNAYVSIGALGYAHFLDAVLRNTDNPNGGSMTPQYPLKGGAYFDMMGYHTYPFLDGSLWTYDISTDRILSFQRNSDVAVDSGLIKKQRFLQNVLDRYGYNGTTYPRKPWVNTEFNMPRRAFDRNYVGSDEIQVNSAIKAAVTSMKTRVTQLHIYKMSDDTTPEDAFFEFQEMGMYRKLVGTAPYNQQIKPVGIAYKTASDFLATTKYDSTRTARMGIPSNLNGGAFRKTDGSFVYVLWAKATLDRSEQASGTYSFPATMGVSGLKRFAWDFSQTGSSSDVASQNINLTSSPIFLTSGAVINPVLPDLTLANLTIPASTVVQGQVFNWKVDIKNIGAGAASGSFSVKSYISTDTILSNDDIQNGTIPTGNYPAGVTIAQVDGATTIPASVAVGTYYLILKVDADNQISETNENNNVLVGFKGFEVTRGQTGGSYCASKSSAPWEMYISNVRFGTINNNSTQFNNFTTAGYSDFRNLSTSVQKGQTYPLSITPSMSWSGYLPNVFCRVWIDFNGDKVFQTNELVLERSNANPLTANVLVPANTVTDNVLMRVSVKWGAYPTACETFDRGEVEDYTIQITDSAGNVCTNDQTPPVFTNCPRDTTVFFPSTQSFYELSWTNPTATDNCSTPSVSSNPATPLLRINDGQTGTVIFTARDAANNTVTCTWRVTARQQTTGGGADLAVTLTGAATYRNYTPYSYTVGVENRGTQAFSDVVVEFKFPEKTVSGGAVTPSVGTWHEWCIGSVQCFEWRIPSLAANGRATLNLPLYVLNPNPPLVATARLLRSTPTDSNAANNSATLSLNQGTPATQGLQTRAVPSVAAPVVLQTLHPSITEGGILVSLESLLKKSVRLNFYDLSGKQVKSEARTLEKGVNALPFDVSDLSKGMYFIQIEGGGVPLRFARM